MTQRKSLGRAVSILLAFEETYHFQFEDLSAFSAPGECYRDVARGQARRFRQVRRHACHVAGVRTLRELRAAVKAVVPTWDRFNHYRLGIESL